MDIRDTTPPPGIQPFRRYSDDDMDALRHAVRRVAENHGMTLTQIAEACHLARGTFTNWLGGTYGGNNHRVASQVSAWIMADYPHDIEAPDEHRPEPTPDLGEIAWYDEERGPMRRGRVVFRANMCARHWAVVAEDEQGRVALILRSDPGTEAATVTVFPTEPGTGRFLASRRLLGRELHTGVERITQILAETALFYASGAGRYL